MHFRNWLKSSLLGSVIELKDVKKTKEAGFTDKVILGLTIVSNYFNFVNRGAIALGVKFSEKEMKGCKG
jgi:hypothetical protein